MVELKYLDWDGVPVIGAPGEFWAFEAGKWSPVKSGAPFVEGRVMSPAEFKSKFGALPSLPTEAFQR